MFQGWRCGDSSFTVIKILRSTISLLGVSGVASQIFFKNKHDGRIVIPKQKLDLLMQDSSNIEGNMMKVSLEHS